MKWFRWQGLVGFLVFSAVVLVLAVFLLPVTIKNALEYTGTEVVGARVNVQKVWLDYWPFTLNIQNVTIADPESPMQNLLVFDQATVSIQLIKLLLNQVIIDDMTLSGMQIGTTRKTSGAIDSAVDADTKKRADSKQTALFNKAQNGLDAVLTGIPDIDTLLSRQPLATDQASRQLKQTYLVAKDNWQDNKQLLPDKTTLQSYESRINALTQTKVESASELIKLKHELSDIKKHIQTDKTTIQRVKAQLTQDQALLKEQLAALKKAPATDIMMLRQTYSLDKSGVLNVSQLLLGGKIRHMIETSYTYYQKALPIWQRLQSRTKSDSDPSNPDTGRLVVFPSDQPNTDFWLKQGDFDLITEAGHFRITTQHLTTDPKAINQPATITVSGEQLTRGAHFLAEAIIDGRKTPITTRLDTALTNYQLSPQTLSQTDHFSLSLKAANMSSTGILALQDDNLEGKATINLLNMALESDANNTQAQQLAQSLATIRTMDAHINLTGTLSNPDIHVQSNVDEQLKGLIASQLKSQRAMIEKQLKKALDKKISEAIAENSQLDSLLKEEQGNLSQTDEQLAGLLEKNLSDITQSSKKGIKKQLKGNLKKWL